MDINTMAEKNIILKIRVGSHLYGTNTPNSDEDFMGIFIPDPKYLLGLHSLNEVDLSVVDKKEDGKNTSKAVDFRIYSLAKFIRLALYNNPNILEILFVNEENIVFISDIGRQLLDIRHKFISKYIKDRFLGYANTQKRKMVIKLGDYKRLTTALKILEAEEDKYLLDIIVRTPCMIFCHDKHPLFLRKHDYVFVGDLQIPITATVKRAYRMIADRLSKFGNRKELMSKHGYDTKFASHLIRLLKEGQELLTTGDLKFPLECATLLRDIKEGKYSMIDVLEMANRIEQDVEELCNNTKVPDVPDEEYVEQFLIDTQKAFILKL